MKNTIARTMVAAAFVVGVAGTASANMILNGDFESGNVNFTSAYEYCNTSGCLATGGEAPGEGAGRYAIGTNPNAFHSSFVSAADHTPGTGVNMMVVNGSTQAGKTVWTGTVAPPMVVNQSYTFSLWAMNVYPDSPAVLSISFGGNLLTNSFSPTGLGVWTQYTTTFTATDPNDHGIIDVNITAFGNDFALDDISLDPVNVNPLGVPDGGATVALLGLGLTAVGLMRRKIS